MTNPNPNPPMPLDLGQFNAITEGKGTYQEELLQLFFLNSSDCVVAMERSCTAESDEKWKQALEELKNISSSIGALELSKVCAVAEKITADSAEERKKILTSIKMHIQRLQAFVRNTRY